MKFLAIILFSFELLTPLMFASAFKNDVEIEQPGRNILTPAVGAGFSAFLLFEEASEEEREGRGDVAYDVNDLYSFQFYATLHHSVGIELSAICTKRASDDKLLLFKLHRVFLI